MRIPSLACLIVASAMVAGAQNSTSPPPQSARQALIEMFLGKGADDFVKHLPTEARKALIRKGESPQTSLLSRISATSRELAAQGNKIETFETGPDILVSEDPNTHEKVEIAVEHDSLFGEEDEIELSAHLYKNGEPQFLPVFPDLTFRLKQEDEVWRLTELTVAAHIPLTDPDYLKGLRKEQDNTDESGAKARMAMIAEAENRYAANHTDAGYTCSLGVLFAPPADPGEANYGAGSANEQTSGYRFSLSGCDGTPASKYKLMAVPVDSDSEMKVFCADQSGMMKFIDVDNRSNCLSSGETLAPAVTTVIE